MDASDDTDGNLRTRAGFIFTLSNPSVSSVVQIVKREENPLCQEWFPRRPPHLAKTRVSRRPPLVPKTKQKRPCLFWPPAGGGARVVENTGGMLEQQSLRRLRFVLQGVDALSEPLPSAGGQ